MSATAPGTDVLDERFRLRIVRSERREIARVRVLAELLQRRPDLADVHRAADLVAESLRWGA